MIYIQVHSRVQNLQNSATLKQLMSLIISLKIHFNIILTSKLRFPKQSVLSFIYLTIMMYFSSTPFVLQVPLILLFLSLPH
jgi:hypothetical protein